MTNNRMPTLRIGDLEINPPIIQGGMGVRVSRAGLASAVANEGCAGIISTIGLGEYKSNPVSRFTQVNEEALRQEIRKARSMTNGVIGANVLFALTDFENLVTTAGEEGVDMIICGAGLPLDLPKFVPQTKTKLIPIVSSVRAFNIICKKWSMRYNRLPDAVIVEGPKAGGHLGFSYEQLAQNPKPDIDQILGEVIDLANQFDLPIPVIAAGGIFDGKDIARVLKLGASGVQMGTRFVCTDECDVHENFKQTYINAKKEDVTIITSPVGMPGKVIKNKFVEKIQRGETVPLKCRYKCLKTCNPKTAPYCIAEVLTNASEGNFDQAFAFGGDNAYRCNEIVPVKQLIGELVEEAEYYLKPVMALAS